MVHFLGIFGPDRFARSSGQEAPNKANFFGGLPDAAMGAVPMTRAEQDACYLSGKAPLPHDGLADPRRDGMPER
ncbi:hypothetical protein [Devosia sediminis]|uniref:Uncharacterized protein n=1 Tax=Devosia sediminis TaxID=2798801 RepID=A0A934J2B1_9HYPH|nr:hypothetical protein [Devosia sediminis]MBJ3786943.1 hypothetical protein [Devosia sediminis]